MKRAAAVTLATLVALGAAGCGDTSGLVNAVNDCGIHHGGAKLVKDTSHDGVQGNGSYEVTCIDHRVRFEVE